MSARRKCVICGIRPVAKGEKAGYCKVCSDQIAAGKSARSAREEVYKYLTYQGKVIALKPSRAEAGVQMYKAERVYKNPESLPKGKLIDLNHYCDGFDRSQIKRMKAMFAKCAA